MQMKLHLLTWHSPPAVWPDSYQATVQYSSMAWDLGMPALHIVIDDVLGRQCCS